MDFRELAKEWRIWVLVFALVASTALLIPWGSPSLFFEMKGDDIGFETNLENRTSIEFSGGTRMLLKLQSNATGQELSKQADEVRQILEIRLSNMNIPDPSVRKIDLGDGKWRIQIEASTSNQTQLKNIIEREGSFEARMPIPVSDSKNFTLGSYTYNFELMQNKTVHVEGIQNNFSTTVKPGDRFAVSDNGVSGYNTSFIYQTYRENTSTANIEVVAYSGQDIKSVVESDSRISGGPGGYQFRFPVIISNAAANNVLHVAQNYEAPFGANYLQHENGEVAKLRLYVDGNMQTALSMAPAFANQVITQPSIQGGAQTREKAVQQMKELQVILESGSLPVQVEVVSTSTLSSSLGSQFMTAAITSIIGSLIAVGVLVFIRYRDPRVVIPLVFTGASEVYILLGAYFTTIGTLSLSAVAGIIAAVGTGVDDQIIITDESGKESLGGWQKKMKRAFFVIFTSAASTIGAMLPILAPSAVSFLVGVTGVSLIGYTLYRRGTNRHYIAIGVFAALVSVFTTSLGPSGAALSTVHEFARTTILGILVGIAITRPAYAKIIEQIKE